MTRPNDATYYDELEMGAEFLAEKASDPAERAAHLSMASVYRRRARDADTARADGKENAR